MPRSGRSLPLDAAFHSPSATACLSPSPRGRVNAPGLHLRSDSRISAWPVRLNALPSPAGFFFAARGTIHTRNPLPSPIPKLPACLRASAPLQDLSVLPDRSARPESKRRSLPLRVARSSFAPRRVATISHYRATDQCSGSATSRQARCPSNLLEPHTSCTQALFRSSEKRAEARCFLKKYPV